MKITKKSKRGGRFLLAPQFQKTAKNCVYEHDVRIEAVDSGREDQIKRKSSEEFIPASQTLVEQNPCKILKDIRPPRRWNFVPQNDARVRSVCGMRLTYRQIGDMLGVEVNLAAVVERKAFELFGKNSLCAMTAVQKGRNDSETQVRRSWACPFEAELQR